MKYGDYSNIRKDVQAINDILYRQGVSIILETIAEKIGQDNLDYKFTEKEVTRLKDSIVNELRDAINERI